MAETSAPAVAANVLTAPAEAFAAIKQAPRAWFPLLVLIAAYAAVSFAFTHSVDLPWFMEQQIDAQARMSGNELTAEQREQAIEGASQMSATALGSISTVSSSVFILLLVSLISLYYTGVSFATGDGIKLKQWFGMTAWSTFPIVLGLLASLANILASDARFMLQEDLNPLTFRNLLSIDTAELGLLQRILANFDLTTVWALALGVIGYHVFTQRPFLQSAGIVLGPLAAILVLATLLAA